MTKEFNLSEKIIKSAVFDMSLGDMITKKDVKEFIKRLKEDIEYMVLGNDHSFIIDFFNIIDKLAGDDLK